MTIHSRELLILVLPLFLGCSFYFEDDDPEAPPVAADARMVPIPDASPLSVDAQFPDASTFGCADDSALEPNQTTSNPTITSIPDLGTSYELINIAICPGSDVDVFSFRIEGAPADVSAEIEFDANVTVLRLAILTGAGATIVVGSQSGSDPNTVIANVLNLAPGTYYARVSSTQGIQNNYDLRLDTPAASP